MQTVTEQLGERPFPVRRGLGFMVAVMPLTVKVVLALCLDEHITPWLLLLLLNVSELCIWLWQYASRYGRRHAFVLCILPLISSIYACISDAILYSGFNIYPFYERTVIEGMYLQSVYVGVLWLSIFICISPDLLRRFVRSVVDWHHGSRLSGIGVNILTIIGMVLALAYRTVFYTSGAAALLESKNRGLIFDTMETGKVWLLTFSFVVWLMAFIVLLINQRARRQIHVVHRVVNLAAVALFFSTYLQLGNRRELLIALLFAGMTLLLHGKYRAVALAGAIALFGGLYLGVARLFDSEARTQLDTPRLLMNMLGEAIFPNFALLSHIESGKELWLGSSYLRFPGNFLPSFGIWQKAQSLSELFAEQYGGGGMAYTHLAEGYANFGVAAVVLIPLAFALFLRLLFTWPVRRQKQQRTVIPGVVFLAMSFDVCRGEFVSNLSELLIVSFMLWLYLGIAKIEIRGKNGQ